MESDWRFVQSSMNNSFKYILETGEMSDCCFLVGSDADNRKKFSAHKLLLRTASPVFEKMFFGSLPENSNAEIEITDIDKEAFHLLLKYIYCVDFEFGSIYLAQKVYAAAEKYMMEHLKKKCIRHLIVQTNAGNVLDIYALTKDITFVEAPELNEQILRVFQQYTHKVVHPNNFSKLTTLAFLLIMEQNTLKIVDEITMFKLVEQYAFYRCLEKEKKSIDANNADENAVANDLMNEMRELVKKIRFLTMSSEDFAKGPAMSKLLTFEESSAIYECLRNANKIKDHYPKGFSASRSTRCNRPCSERFQCRHCRTYQYCNGPH